MYVQTAAMTGCSNPLHQRLRVLKSAAIRAARVRAIAEAHRRAESPRGNMTSSRYGPAAKKSMTQSAPASEAGNVVA